MSGLGRDAKDLIERVGNADGPTRTDRDRVRRLVATSLGIASSAAATTVAVGSAGASVLKSVGASQIALWLCVGTAVGAAVSAPLVLDSPAPAMSAAPAPRRVRARVSAPRSMPAPLPSAAIGDAQAPVEPSSPSRAALDVSKVEPSKAVPSAPSVAAFPLSPPRARAPRLREETRLLERAQKARAQGRPDVALGILHEYARAFPSGVLRSESLGARVLCLCELGRAAEAQALAEQLVRSDPGSPLIPRLSQSCVDLAIRR
jgi:hypothetical protein